MDNLSAMHFRAIREEIVGRFFSKEEAEQLKIVIDIHTITDPEIRAEAAKCWTEPQR